MHLAQPTFSRSIQALEDEMGERLFDRDTAVVKPTPAGALPIERGRKLLFDMRCLQRDCELYGDGQVGDAAFGFGIWSQFASVLGELRCR